MKKLLTLSCLFALSCGGGNTLTVGDVTLAIASEGYAEANTFGDCDALPPEQIRIVIGDQPDICATVSSPEFPVDGKDHAQLVLELGMLGHDVPTDPYTVSNFDCTVGGSNARVTLYSRKAGASAVQSAVAVSGSVTISQMDTTGTKNAHGTYSVLFGTNEHVNGSFNATFCATTN